MNAKQWDELLWMFVGMGVILLCCVIVAVGILLLWMFVGMGVILFVVPTVTVTELGLSQYAG